MKQKHTTKKGPGRFHVNGTNRGSTRNKEGLPFGDPGDKLRRAAIRQTLGMRV